MKPTVGDFFRLLSQVELTPEGCWDWQGHVGSDGYGKARASLWTKTRMAHRIVYQMLRGHVGSDQQLDHLCRNRRCVNPAHLEPVSPRTNTLRGETLAAANAEKTRCKHGHPFDEENTFVERSGKRQCRECRRTRGREWARAHKEATNARSRAHYYVKYAKKVAA